MTVHDGHHPDDDVLNALLDGELNDSALDEADNHVAGCETCQDRLGELSAARDAVAAPVQPLAEPVRAGLVANAIAAAVADVPEIKAARSARRRQIDTVLGRVAAVVLAAGLVGSAIYGIRSAGQSAPSAAIAGVGTSTTVEGGASTTLPDEQSTTTSPVSAGSGGVGGVGGSTGSSGSTGPATPRAIPAAGLPAPVLSHSVIEVRSVLARVRGRCAAESAVRARPVVLPVESGVSGGKGTCLRVSDALVFASSHVAITVIPTAGAEHYLALALSGTAAALLERDGALTVAASVLTPPSSVAPISKWRMVAVSRGLIIGDVIEVVDVQAGAYALVGGVPPATARRLSA